MPELRPLVAEWLDAQAGRVDDALRLFGIDRADGVEDRAARLDACGRDPQQLLLQVRKRLSAPAQVWTRGEDTESGARRVDQYPLESRQLRR